MGLCASSMTPEQKAQAAMNKEIEKQQRGTQNAEDQKIKLLLLGTFAPLLPQLLLPTPI